MAMSMLPMLASALSGLGAGGNNGSGGSTGTGSGGGDTGTGGDGELSPQAQKAIKALQTLADAYGDKNSKDPEVQKVRKQLGITGNNNTTGSGSTATAVKAKQLYQRNAAAAFNNLDNDLYNYIKTHAGKHKIDKTAVRQLLRDVDAALNELGPTAFTKTGQQKVHQILALALKKAQAIVSGGNTNSTETATEIKRLTNQYLYNIYGKKYPKASTKTVGGTLGQWIQQALQIMKQKGYDVSGIDPQDLYIIGQHESNGNPKAVNDWDINAKNGIPTTGIMQLTPPNFRKYSIPGHKNIYDPVDNIIAGIQYSKSRYGSVSNVPGVKAVRAGNAYVPY